MEELLRYMRALVLLQLNPPGGKAELALARAGFAHREIADMLGKSHAAVAKTISRAKSGKAGDDDTEATQNE